MQEEIVNLDQILRCELEFWPVKYKNVTRVQKKVYYSQKKLNRPFLNQKYFYLLLFMIGVD